MRIGGNIKLGDSEITVNDIANGIKSIIKCQTISGLNLESGSNYQLNLPSNVLFIEPLVSSHGSQYSGGQIVIIGGAYTYITNNDNTDSENIHRGIWISCNNAGLVSISSYRHCGCPITGFRIWYIDI